MSKSNSFKKSRKLALGIAVAMGCSFATVAFADGAIVNDTGEDKLLSFNDALVISADGNRLLVVHGCLI